MKLIGKKRKQENTQPDLKGDKDIKEKRTPKKKPLKKKEKPIPWGKKERVIVFLILFISTFFSALLALASRNFKLPGIPKISLSSIGGFGKLLSFGEKTYTYTLDDVYAQRNQKIKDAYNDLESKSSGVYALYLFRLNDDSSLGINENEVLQAASLIKLPVMTLIYEKSEKEGFDLDSSYTLRNEDKVSGSGSLYGKPSGYKITYRSLVELMGKESDNTAFNIVRNYLGDEEISNYIQKIGMDRTSLSDNKTSARDIGVFFEKLWKLDLVNQENRDEILSFLTDTIYEDYLPRSFPDEIMVSHKYAREVNVINDGGIIFSEKPFVVVIISQGIIESQANDFFKEIGKVIFEAEIGGE